MSANAAPSMRRLAASLSVAVVTLAGAACLDHEPTGPGAPADANEQAFHPEREPACKLPDPPLRPRLEPSSCPFPGLGRSLD